jgi:dienelactone hydrolase
MKVFRLLGFLLLAGLGANVYGAVRGEEVSYQHNGVTMKGYIAWDDSIKGRRPGVLVVHEWWGHDDYARRRARQLAELGYTALAVDMYGNGKKADHPKDAGQFSGEVKKNLPMMSARFNAAKKLLSIHPTVDARLMAGIGYCFGGTVLLEMARQGTDLSAVVSFHGSLATENPAKPGEVQAKVLVLNGAADPMINADAVQAFVREMKNAKADFRVVNYPGAKHSFTNPAADGYGKKFGIPLAYDARADRQSWGEMKAFLASVFK